MEHNRFLPGCKSEFELDLFLLLLYDCRFPYPYLFLIYYLNQKKILNVLLRNDTSKYGKCCFYEYVLNFQAICAYQSKIQTFFWYKKNSDVPLFENQQELINKYFFQYQIGLEYVNFSIHLINEHDIL